MGRVKKGQPCTYSGCDKPSVKSLSVEEATKAFGSSDLAASKTRRVYLCGEHYKMYKKKARKEKSLERWRWG